MHCWICGSEASSGEHLVKESTLKDLFGEVNQRKPLYYSNARIKNRRLQSTDSKFIKLRVLCGKCNSSTTQPLDRAWDEFLTFLRINGDSLNTGSVLRFYRVFAHNARRKMLNLHLY